MTDAVVGTIFVTVLGGLLAIAGSLVATWFKSRTSRRTRMNEVIAERKVEAGAQAYQYMKEIETSLVQKPARDTLALIESREDWLLANRLFLPGSFPEKWASLRTTVEWLAKGPFKRAGDTERAHEVWIRALALARDAMNEVREDMDLWNDGRETTSRED